MKEIKLTQGYVALVDDEDYERVNQFKWQVKKSKNLNHAKRSIKINGIKTTQYMHNYILNNLTKEYQVDHIDIDGLNNQKINIRLCTHTENIRNRRSFTNTSSKYKGVHLIRKTKRYNSSIEINHKSIHIGNFKSEIEAAKAYDKKAKKLFGEFAYLNFKDIDITNKPQTNGIK